MIGPVTLGKSSGEEGLLWKAGTRRVSLKPGKNIYIYDKTIKVDVVNQRASCVTRANGNPKIVSDIHTNGKPKQIEKPQNCHLDMIDGSSLRLLAKYRWDCP